jgi:hypothetical protein
MAEAQNAAGHATKKQIVEEALRLMIRLRRRQDVGTAFGKYRWRGDLARSRRGREGAGAAASRAVRPGWVPNRPETRPECLASRWNPAI